MNDVIERSHRTQVGIIGAGPSGLVLGRILRLHGIDSVILEARDRGYCEHRVRAGVLEHDTAGLLEAIGVGDRMRREGLVHRGIALRFDGDDHRVDLAALTGGRTITVYGQHEIIKDLIDASLRDGPLVVFEASDVAIEGSDSGRPRIRYRHADEQASIDCDVVVGCDGHHGVSRGYLPESTVRTYERTYPFAWLGLLVATPPASEELVYVRHERGFALMSMRSPNVTRLYLQCPQNERLEDWSDDRLWSELHLRFRTRDENWRLNEGPILQRGITPMRSFVTTPMQHRRFFLAGDAAHIVPPTGAKGLNLALADIRVLAAGLIEYYDTGSWAALDRYSCTCLRRIWTVQRFSAWMTMLLHRSGDEFEDALRTAELAYVARSRAAATALAENYVGLPFEEGGLRLPARAVSAVMMAQTP